MGSGSVLCRDIGRRISTLLLGKQCSSLLPRATTGSTSQQVSKSFTCRLTVVWSDLGAEPIMHLVMMFSGARSAAWPPFASQPLHQTQVEPLRSSKGSGSLVTAAQQFHNTGVQTLVHRRTQSPLATQGLERQPHEA